MDCGWEFRAFWFRLRWVLVNWGTLLVYRIRVCCGLPSGCWGAFRVVLVCLGGLGVCLGVLACLGCFWRVFGGFLVWFGGGFRVTYLVILGGHFGCFGFGCDCEILRLWRVDII